MKERGIWEESEGVGRRRKERGEEGRKGVERGGKDMRGDGSEEDEREENRVNLSKRRWIM